MSVLTDNLSCVLNLTLSIVQFSGCRNLEKDYTIVKKFFTFDNRCDIITTVGVNNNEGPPVPIPNTVVKLIRAENTWWEAAREDRSMPTQKHFRM